MSSLIRIVCWRGVVIAAALVTDRLLSDPPNRFHPVAWFGSLMGRFESRLWADCRRSGMVYTMVGLLPAWVIAMGRAKKPKQQTPRLLALDTMVVASTLGGRQLVKVAEQIADCLDQDDLDGARAWMPWLVGRDPCVLDESGVAAATIESLAENSVDAVVAPLFWTLAAGTPGSVAYRSINTMDAMVGHHSNRYENFGWASARLDDLANYLPARIWVLLVGLVGSTPLAEVVDGVKRDAPKHPSPNAGPAETAVAYSLGLCLGGPLKYPYRSENRPYLGDGRAPDSDDIRRTIKLVKRVERTIMLGSGIGAACLLAVTGALAKASKSGGTS